MAVRNIKRWQWILLSIVAGLAVGYCQQLPSENWQSAFGDTITQQQFEEGILRKQNGQHWFRNIVIYPERVEVAGKTVPVAVVAGDYFNGTLESQKGQRVAVWHRRCFIAEEPFRPIVPIGELNRGNAVISYLNSVPGVSYTYAWWRDSTWALSLWTGGSFVILGLIWPTLINLLIFGSVRRPREKRAISLRNVSAQTSQSTPQPTNSDLTDVTKMADKIEAKLSNEARPQTPGLQSPAVAPPARQLAATNVESPLKSEPQEQKHYGQDKDDFYPTEVHKTHP